MNLLIRADGDARMGTGHLMRCLALAQAWRDAGGAVTFRTACEIPLLLARLWAEGAAVERVEGEPGGLRDADHTREAARRLGAEWVVLDGYHFGAEFQSRVRPSARVLAFDDYGHAGRYTADVVLNQNLHADEGLYRDREAHTRLLLGTRHALLRREFAGQTEPIGSVPDVGREVLVTLGGADPDNVTLKVIRALAGVRVEGLRATVVVGGGNPHREELEAAARASPAEVEVRVNVTDLAALMRRADAAVAAGGSTSWELARLGLPSLVLVLADNQEAVAASLDAAGVARSLGWGHAVTEGQLAAALTDLLRDPAARAEMARRGRELVDGNGARRVVAEMMGSAYRFRPASADDAALLWQWANDPAVRHSAFSPEPIPWEGHQAWFARRLADPDCRIYIAEDWAGQPVGQIRFDRTPAGEADVDVSVAPNRRGGGAGAAVIRGGVERVLADGWAPRVHAYIKADNAASVAAFRKAGFAVLGEVEVRGQRAIHTTRGFGGVSPPTHCEVGDG